jgi:hypothetical protein
MQPSSSGAVSLPDLILALLAPFTAFAFMAVLSTALRDGDTGWHLATGAWIVAHAGVPHADPFSFTAPGKPWIAHEWLSELLMFLAFRTAGWGGLMLLFGAALATLYAQVALHLRRWMSPTAAALTLVYMSIGLMPSLLARPHLLALPILAGWLLALMRARELNRAPSLWLAALMLVWANVHGSFVFGLALAGVFALEALITAVPARRLEIVVRWGSFGSLCLVAALLTPAGLEGLLYPFYVNGLALLPLIGEWRPANFSGVSGFEVVLLSALFFLLYRPTRVPVIRLLLVLGVLHLGLEHIRQQIVLMVVGTLVLAEPIGRAWSSRELPRAPLLSLLWRDRRELMPIFAVGLLLFSVVAGSRLLVPFVRPDSYGVPITAIRHIPRTLRSQPVFSEYSFGGLLIFQGIRPYIDGRSDMYGDAFTQDYVRIAHGDAGRWSAAQAKWKFAWTILPPDTALVAILDKDKGWHRLYADKWAVVHVADRAGFDISSRAGPRAQ